MPPLKYLPHYKTAKQLGFFFFPVTLLTYIDVYFKIYVQNLKCTEINKFKALLNKKMIYNNIKNLKIPKDEHSEICFVQ